MDGANRHPQPRRLHERSFCGTHMVGRGRGQARLAIRSMSAPARRRRSVKATPRAPSDRGEVRAGARVAAGSEARRQGGVRRAGGTTKAVDGRCVDQLGPGYRAARGPEVPDWVVAVAHHLPSYKVGRLLHKWAVEIPKVLMPNRQRTLRSFFSAAGAPGAAGTARPTAPAATAADTALTPSAGAGDSER